MNSLIDEYIGIDPNYIIIGILAFCIILFFLLIITMIKVSKIKKKYNLFMSGNTAESLENLIIKKFGEIDNLKEASENNERSIYKINEELLLTMKKTGIVKYDAFHEMGGKLSFALAILNDKNDGFVLNAMHSREGCYTYIKEILKGKSFIVLGEEEKQAVEQAINSNSITE